MYGLTPMAWYVQEDYVIQSCFIYIMNRSTTHISDWSFIWFYSCQGKLHSSCNGIIQCHCIIAYRGCYEKSSLFISGTRLHYDTSEIDEQLYYLGCSSADESISLLISAFLQNLSPHSAMQVCRGWSSQWEPRLSHSASRETPMKCQSCWWLAATAEQSVTCQCFFLRGCVFSWSWIHGVIAERSIYSMVLSFPSYFCHHGMIQSRAV